MSKSRLTSASKVWLGFFAFVMILGIALMISRWSGESEEAAEGLQDALRTKGEPYRDCLARVRTEYPSYGSGLVERLCQGR